MRWWIVLAMAACGCNQVFGLDSTELIDAAPASGDDIDLDGVPDGSDPCIAATQDSAGDYDEDGSLNGDDTCPLDDTRQSALDSDGDHIPDSCDPFPAASGDVKRCFMRFTNSDLNSRLWKERGATMEWDLPSGQLRTLKPTSTASLLSTRELHGSDEPTFDVDLIVNGDPVAQHAVQVWARASDPQLQNNVGCQLLGMQGYTQLAIILGGGGDIAQMTTFNNFPVGVALRLRLTYSTDASAANVACMIVSNPGQVNQTTYTVKAMTALPDGTLGFGVENGQVSITALTIYDRAMRLPLP